MEKVLDKDLLDKSVHELIGIADRIFSELVRRMYADHSARAKCSTCTFYNLWRMLTCGHYQNRRHNATRWEIKNAGPQCMKCQGDGQGEVGKMAEWLDKTHGPGTSELMVFEAHKDFRLDKMFLIDKITELKKRLNEL